MEPLSSVRSSIQAEAERLGFRLFGITLPTSPPHLAVYEEWLAQSRQAEMDYLATPRARRMRAEPQKISPNCQSVICLGVPYSIPNLRTQDPSQEPPKGRVAAYAQGADYHLILENRIADLAAAVEKALGKPVRSRGYTDTGPILERDLAQQAGLGWIGKNSCLINPRHGSFFLLAEIFTEARLEPDPPFQTDQCGSCRRCIEACPTGCILENRTLDAGRCISYLTIENNKTGIPPELRSLIGDWVFGCDVCQAVCPWNLRFASLPPLPDLLPWTTPDLLQVLLLSEAEFSARYRGSPIRRAKRKGFLRNAAVVLGNLMDPSSVPILAYALANDPDGLVRSHSAWALGQIRTRQAVDALEKARRTEPNATVLAEIIDALDNFIDNR